MAEYINVEKPFLENIVPISDFAAVPLRFAVLTDMLPKAFDMPCFVR